MILIVAWRTALEGRVSPRPQDRGHNCIRLGREPLREAKAFGLMRRWVAGAVSERRALPPGQPRKYLRLTRMGGCRIHSWLFVLLLLDT
jgi:hypothetical protein